MSALLASPDLLDSQFDALEKHGWTLLQPFRYGPDDAAHIQALLTFADLPQDAQVLDVGCGTGACARMLYEQRPDLVFTLVNFSERQLDACPLRFNRVLATAHDLPFPDESFDVVMFHAALGNMDAMVALAEAARVLKPDGVLFLNELAGDSPAMEQQLQFRAFDPAQLATFCRAMGLAFDAYSLPGDAQPYLKDFMTPADYAACFDGVRPMMQRYVKRGPSPVAARYGSLFARHERIALQFSGGKDSLALLYAMRPWWDRLCVYWVNPGDPFPETVELMAQVRAMVPWFVEVPGRMPGIIERDGWPSDVVPQAHTSDGNMVFGPTPFKVQSRLSCCFRALMMPMYERMVTDGVQCVLRGKRAEEKDKTGVLDGHVCENGIRYYFPLYDWTKQQVLDYLTAAGVALPGSYDLAGHSLDCMGCTAWWGEGLSRFLADRYPERHTEYVRRVTLIKQAVADQLLECEV